MKRFLANYWFAPIYLGLVLLAAHDHVLTGRYLFGVAIVMILTALKALWRRRGPQRGPRPANDY